MWQELIGRLTKRSIYRTEFPRRERGLKPATAYSMYTCRQLTAEGLHVSNVSNASKAPNNTSRDNGTRGYVRSNLRTDADRNRLRRRAPHHRRRKRTDR